MPTPKIKTLVTCEHAKKRIPKFCSKLLPAFIQEVETHRIYDPGAKEIARHLAKNLNAPLYEGKLSRLAIDLNRSVSNESLFAEPVQASNEALKAKLIAKHYIPFREKVEKRIEKWISKGYLVYHLSIHTFTPVLDRNFRELDIGVLFDASCPIEKIACNIMIEKLRIAHPTLTIKANKPYKGTDDGHTTALRRRFRRQYAGIELEYNQALNLVAGSKRWAKSLANSYSLSIPKPRTLGKAKRQTGSI